MDVFALDQSLVSDYERFARSFTGIRADDIRAEVDAIYASRRFWPEPLLSINPHFERGASIDELVADASLTTETGKIFRIGGNALVLHRHQAQALAKSKARQSFVVTTGTGSGKSLCFFIPIIDRIVRARVAGEVPRTRAIIVYPMNALANSQMKEIAKFLEQSGLPPALRPTYARYTGQETKEERDRIRSAKPDILLTNFMMLELLMTRQNERDQAVMDAAQGLEFLVLDELHTYRGRQGADVSMLVRRVRDRLCREKPPIYIGTSATMSSDGGEARAQAVAAVASRLFGASIGADAVIEEHLQRATNPTLNLVNIKPSLAAAVDQGIAPNLTDAKLRNHPIAVWIELRIGLSDGQKLERRPPITIEQAAHLLAVDSSRPQATARQQIQTMLTVMSTPASARGGSSDRAFLAFKLHRFISGAGNVYATLRLPGQRRVTLDGQQNDPLDPEARLYPTFFCRSCGQEYHPAVWAHLSDGECFVPRSMDDTPNEDEAEIDKAGYLMPTPIRDVDFEFTGEPNDYPEEWLEFTASGPRLKKDKRKFAPQSVKVEADGAIGTVGRAAWFVPGKFRFCLCCRDVPPGQARERTKLASLSAEGRSSATTLLVSSVLRWMQNPQHSVPETKRKLLSFTDNRQDAALQAGHFNDFLFVSLLRGAVLAAARAAGEEGLGDDDIGGKVQATLGFNSTNVSRRNEWMLEPDAKGVGQINASKTLVRVLAHRTWADQRRGWRYTNPNLEQLGLIRADYLSLDDLAADDSAFSEAHDALRHAAPEKRMRALRILLDFLRQGLAVTTESLSEAKVDEIANASRQALKEPWSLGQQEKQRTAAALMIDAPRREQTGIRGENLLLRGGPRGALAKKLNRVDLWGERLSSDLYIEVLTSLLAAAESYSLVRSVPTAFDTNGWQIAANAIRFVAGDGRVDGPAPNSYFVSLYENLADALSRGGDGLFGLEGREHTAQVDQERREWREWRFRWEQEDREKLDENKEKLRLASEPDDFLPVLFCSPTMELGVDISALNAVYLRNVPPTPANYAQRSGRAGRSGQAALVITYCSAQGPHDQYYFARPAAMVSGVVRPPALDLANRDLIEAHLHAVWLAEAGVELAADIPHVLNLHDAVLPIRSDIETALQNQDLARRAAIIMERILDSVENELSLASAPWAADRRALAETVSAHAFERFSQAFDRWRQLYSGARAQLVEANRRSEMHGLPAAERKDAKIQQLQANEQITLLERGDATASSDFYSYRYLATEGFLPGYNFPRLPLYAFVPATEFRGAKAAYLQRARFLAIAEFGPGSLIYHEGRAYRVHKARLPANLRTGEGRLATTKLFICDECGAAHDQEVERCHACAASMTGVHAIKEILRIDNVETLPAERITANDEERQRRGFEIQTVFTWPTRDDRYDVQSAVASDADGPILRVDYAPGALVSRVNKGLRRRKEKSICGFGIDPATGRWTKGPDDNGDDTPETPSTQRVVPIVQDNKNAALLRLAGAPSDAVEMTTLQHALARGLDMVFQLEEGETLSEPTPSSENRRAILMFEATEGGAGVLSRLVMEATALAKVARAALELMHLENIDAAIEAAEPALLRDSDNAGCVKGCYRCLLSYYNQPDHEKIDRTNVAVRSILLRLARSAVAPLAQTDDPAEDGWRAAFAHWRLPPPDAQPFVLGELVIPLVWRDFLVIAAAISLTKSQEGEISEAGYAFVKIPVEPGETPPAELTDLLGAAV